MIECTCGKTFGEFLPEVWSATILCGCGRKIRWAAAGHEDLLAKPVMSECIGNVWIDEKRQQKAEIERLQARVAEYQELVAQLQDKLHCMCGSPIDHSGWEWHSPMSMWDYALGNAEKTNQRRERLLRECFLFIWDRYQGGCHDAPDGLLCEEIQGELGGDELTGEQFAARIRAELAPPVDAGPQHEEG